MNKKILVGSIIAVTILVLVSFTGAVGYQTTSSTNARVSPLFNMRISRAIDKDSKDFACYYVGKGKTTLITIPKRDDRTVLIHKFLDIISKMDDKTFNRFIGLVINRMKQNGNTGIENVDIINTLNQVRTKKEVKGVILANWGKPKAYSVDEPCTLQDWKPNCLLIKLTILIFSIYAIIYICLFFPDHLKEYTI